MSVTERPWFLYLLATAEGALYTGISTDVTRRLREHAAGRGARSLRGRGPLHLCWTVEIGTRGLALRAEYRFKRWPRARKLATLATPPSRERLLRELGMCDDGAD